MRRPISASADALNTVFPAVITAVSTHGICVMVSEIVPMAVMKTNTLA